MKTIVTITVAYNEEERRWDARAIHRDERGGLIITYTQACGNKEVNAHAVALGMAVTCRAIGYLVNAGGIKPIAQLSIKTPEQLKTLDTTVYRSIGKVSAKPVLPKGYQTPKPEPFIPLRPSTISTPKPYVFPAENRDKQAAESKKTKIIMMAHDDEIAIKAIRNLLPFVKEKYPLVHEYVEHDEIIAKSLEVYKTRVSNRGSMTPIKMSVVNACVKLNSPLKKQNKLGTLPKKEQPE